MDEYSTDTPGWDENEEIFRQIRSDIQAGNLIRPEDLSQAEALLDGVEDHCAEWYFLKGAICYRKGWMDEAWRHYEEASRMEPENPEYRRTVERMDPRRRPGEKVPYGTLCSDNACLAMGCAWKAVSCGYACCGCADLCLVGWVVWGCWRCMDECPD